MISGPQIFLRWQGHCINLTYSALLRHLDVMLAIRLPGLVRADA